MKLYFLHTSFVLHAPFGCLLLSISRWPWSLSPFSSWWLLFPRFRRFLSPIVFAVIGRPLGAAWWGWGCPPVGRPGSVLLSDPSLSFFHDSVDSFLQLINWPLLRETPHELIFGKFRQFDCAQWLIWILNVSSSKAHLCSWVHGRPTVLSERRCSKVVSPDPAPAEPEISETSYG